MQKIYTASLYLNSILSVLFILLMNFGLLSTENKSTEDWFFFSYFMLVFSIFLLLSFRGMKLNKRNTELAGIRPFQRKAGKVIAIITIVFAVSLIFVTAAGFLILNNEATKEQLRYWWVYILTLSLLMVTAVTAVINAVLYFKALKKNTALVSDYINSIGA